MHTRSLRHILKKYAVKARPDTGNDYYDASYPGLILAANRVRRQEHGMADIVLIAHGIAGWNRGFGTAPNAGILIQHLRHETRRMAFLLTIHEVMNLETSKNNSDSIRRKILDALREAQTILGIRLPSSLTVASKLLHFFAPRFLPPLDTNVAKVLTISKSARTYVDYACGLLDLGFSRSTAPDNELARYWQFQGRISPVRAVDCTLYCASKT